MLYYFTVGAFEDIGYTVDAKGVYTSPSGAGLFPPGAISGVGGVLIRGQEITVESVWDDTDITHVYWTKSLSIISILKLDCSFTGKPDESLL